MLVWLWCQVSDGLVRDRGGWAGDDAMCSKSLPGMVLTPQVGLAQF